MANMANVGAPVSRQQALLNQINQINDALQHNDLNGAIALAQQGVDETPKEEMLARVVAGLNQHVQRSSPTDLNLSGHLIEVMAARQAPAVPAPEPLFGEEEDPL